jgi:hypothetical protein
MYGGMDVKLHAFLSLALRVAERPAGHPATLIPAKELWYRLMAAWVGPRHYEEDWSAVLTRRIEP